MTTDRADNPYDILGVPRDASMDEVKKAYRRKARENHPDLHPNDPEANKRMNQINEAYDRIVNPSKYAREDARHRAASDPATNPFAGYGNPTGGAGAGGNPFGGAGGNPYGGAGAGGPYGSAGAGGASGPYGGGNPHGGGPHSGPTGQYQWTTDDWTTFTWDDIFSGGVGQQAPIHPEPSATDSPEVVRAINLMNAGNAREALKILQAIPSTGRNARWFYLSAVANQGAGNSLRAHEHMQKARQLDPSNPDYQRAAASFTQQATDYEQESQTRGFSTGFFDPSTLCCCLCWSTMLCQPFIFCL